MLEDLKNWRHMEIEVLKKIAEHFFQSNEQKEKNEQKRKNKWWQNE